MTERQADQAVVEDLRAENLRRVRGTELIATVPPGVSIAGLIAHAGRAILATSEGVYALNGDTFVPLEIQGPPGG